MGQDQDGDPGQLQDIVVRFLWPPGELGKSLSWVLLGSPFPGLCGIGLMLGVGVCQHIADVGTKEQSVLATGIIGRWHNRYHRNSRERGKQQFTSLSPRSPLTEQAAFPSAFP